MSREQEARNDARAAGGGQREPADQEARPSSDGTDDGPCPPTRAVQDDATTDRWLKVRQEETNSAIRRDQAATDNAIRRLEAESQARIQEEAAHAREQRRTLHAYGSWVLILVVAPVVFIGVTAGALAVSGRLLDVSHAIPLSAVGGLILTLGAAGIRRWIRRRAGRSGSGPPRTGGSPLPPGGTPPSGSAE